MKNRRLWISILAGVMALVLLLTLIVGILPRDASATTSSELKDQLDELQSQKDELANIYKGHGTQKEKEAIYELLFSINPSQSAFWDKIKE